MVSSECDARTSRLLARIGLSPPQRLYTLRRPSADESKCSLPGDDLQARQILIQQRTAAPGYRPPETRWRNRLSSRRRKRESNEDDWVFSDYEVATALNSLFRAESLGPAGLVETVFLQSSSLSLDEVWKRLQSGKHSLLIKRNQFRNHMLHELPWLNTAAECDAADHVRVMCQSVFSTQAIDKALEIAVSKHSLATIKVLLSFGADPNRCTMTIRDQLQRKDLALAMLLLSAPKGLIAEAWRYCLEPCYRIGQETLSIVLAHRPDVVSEHSIQAAIQAKHVTTATVFLAYASSEDVARYDCISICRQAFNILDVQLKLAFLDLLSEAGCLVDCADTRQELLSAVKLRRLPLIRLLARSGVMLDGEPHNVLVWISNSPDPDVFEAIELGTRSRRGAASDAFCLLPLYLSEAILLRALEMFTHLSAGTLQKKDLSGRLVDACSKGYILAATALLSSGAEPAFNEAAAIHATIKSGCIDLLQELLRHPCSSKHLSELAKTATALSSRITRQQVFKALVTQHFDPTVLGATLENIVGETGDLDHELIELLVVHKASPDLSDSWKVNSTLTATRKGELKLLKLFCSAGASLQTLARAVCVAYSAREALGISNTTAIMEVLLTSGAFGTPVNDTLRAAVHEHVDVDIVRLLVRHGADVNGQDAECLLYACKGQRHELLQVLCSSSTLKAASVLRTLLVAVSNRHYDQRSLDIILEFKDHDVLQQVCDILWTSDPFIKGLAEHDHASEIVFSFLQHGLNIRLTNDQLLILAVQMKDDMLARALLCTNRSIDNLSSAFSASLLVTEKSRRIAYMRMLLDSARSAEIGQSRALASEVQSAIKDNDCQGVALLLEHNASINSADGGEAVNEAAICGTGPVLSMLLNAKPRLDILERACIAAAESRQLSDTQKREACESILGACEGLLASYGARLLHESVLSNPRNVSLPRLLLERGVEVNDGTLKVALSKASPKLLGVLLQHCHASVVIILSRRLTLPPCRRALIYPMVLSKPDHGIPSVYLSHMLLDTLRVEDIHDLALAKLLLKHGADVGYSKAAPVRNAIESQSLTAVKLLSQYIKTYTTGDHALSHMTRTNVRDSSVRRSMFECLLKRRVTRNACSSSLRLLFASDSRMDDCIVRQLRAKGAEPTPVMFVKAARSNSSELFTALCSGLALLNKTIEGLAGDSTQGATSDMRDMSCCISPEVGPEPCTLLIWALLARPRVPTDAVMAIFGQQSYIGQIDYVTPETHVSAAFACLLDVARLPVLRALLVAKKDAVVTQMVPSKTLAHFAIHTEDQSDENIDLGAQPLHMASFYLGNSGAFDLLVRHIPRTLASDEGLLHLATFLALPKIVKSLMQTHGPNECLEDFGNYIPLAVALTTTTASPWAIVANQEADFATRRRETTQLLAPITSLDWRDRGKTVVHFALHESVETTDILLNALQSEFALESSCHQKFLYRDKEDRIYNLREYVQILMTDVNEENKKKLIQTLEKAGVAGS